jgi:predicted nucleotidyltransferase
MNDDGELPLGVHPALLTEVIARFGVGTAQRKTVSHRLERIYRVAHASGHLARFVVFGSYVTGKAEPNDVDVFMLMEDSFDASTLIGETKVLFDHPGAQAHFGASVFWLRKLAAWEGEQAAVEYWQVKRGKGQRGIVEILPEVS